jgi:polyisoprenoid-binding protein YceI
MSTTTAATANATAVETWSIDPSHSAVEFAVRHMMVTTTKGRFSDVAGTITMPDGDPAKGSVEVTINADSIDTRDAKRDEHLRSNDFFGAGDNPTLSFVSTRVEPKGGNEYRVFGNLTIKGVTRDVVLDAAYNGQGVNPWGMTVAGWEATTKINREDYGLTWNAALEGGGLLVSPEVKIHLDVELVKQG